jgi:Ni/Fe-hydrogenase b-type cytochrome subunit
MTAPKEFHHPFIVRLTHWLNFLALAIMVTSGLRIYNASPIWSFKIPASLTLGGWLAGARQWHFFGMWVFALNGLVWLLYTIASRHGRETTLFRWRDRAGIVPMVKYYLRIRKDHPPVKKYNSLQKLAYSSLPFVGLAGFLSGLALYWPVQFSRIAHLFGGYDNARIWHFLCMSAIVLFFAGHLLMVVIAGWRNFVSMITGWGEGGMNSDA